MRKQKAWSFGLALACGLLLSLAGARVHAQGAEDARPVILAVGESTTAGYGVPAGDSYPAQLQRLLEAEGYHYRVVNYGLAGSTVAMALASADRGLRLHPRIVLIAIGGNDDSNRVPATVTQQNLHKLVMLYVRSGAAVYLADRTSEADGSSAKISSYAAIAQEEGATLMPSLRQQLVGHAELLLADQRHPNADGYAIVSKQIFDVLQPKLIKP